MANTNPTLEPGGSSCFYAQTFLGLSNEYGNGSLNQDLGGVCVALANIVISLLLRERHLTLCNSPLSHNLSSQALLVKWSEDVSSVVLLLYTQTIPILLSVLFSLRTQNLSLFDAHYAATVVASPVSISLLHLVYCIVVECRQPSSTKFLKREPP